MLGLKNLIGGLVYGWKILPKLEAEGEFCPFWGITSEPGGSQKGESIGEREKKKKKSLG